MEGKKTLPPHRNIVQMYSVFTDRVPDLPRGRQLYPDALPPRIHPTGSGRNMSLFLVMKRYVEILCFMRTRYAEAFSCGIFSGPYLGSNWYLTLTCYIQSEIELISAYRTRNKFFSQTMRLERQFSMLPI